MAEKKNEQYFNEERFRRLSTLEKLTEELLKPLDMPLGDVGELQPLQTRPRNAPIECERHVLWDTNETNSFMLEPDSRCIFSPDYAEI